LKFDGAATDRNNPRTLALIREADIQGQEVVFLAGSTQAPEELYAIRAFARLCDDYPQLRLILVPRHPERFEEVAGLLRESGLAWNRRSEPGDAPPARVLLVDVVGELGAWWGRADIGFVGGSLGKRGGQNMIEPAAYGVATSFGPNTKNFRDVVGLLLQREAAVVVSNEAELAEFLQRCLDDITYRRQLGRRAAETVLQQIGAADRTVSMLTTLLNEAVSEPAIEEDGRDASSHLRRTA
jgi:3-deoxy-D-manno-octulosonic-acid transferase